MTFEPMQLSNAEYFCVPLSRAAVDASRATAWVTGQTALGL